MDLILAVIFFLYFIFAIKKKSTMSIKFCLLVLKVALAPQTDLLSFTRSHLEIALGIGTEINPPEESKMSLFCTHRSKE